jgi:hypothetical protein
MAGDPGMGGEDESPFRRNIVLGTFPHCGHFLGNLELFSFGRALWGQTG